MSEKVSCPLKPGLKCSASVRLGAESHCIRCIAWRTRRKPRKLQHSKEGRQ